jgi:hypothetical protein
LDLQLSLAGLAKAFPFMVGMSLLIDGFQIHMTIHVLGVALAAVLAVVSCNVYLRDLRPKILLLTVAFLLLGVEQVMELLQSLGFGGVNVQLPFVGIELLHAVSFGAIAFLTAGVLKKA